jgi:hypothetical protein
MAGVIVKHIDDLDSYEGRGTFLYARKGLGEGVTLLVLGGKPGSFEANV